MDLCDCPVCGKEIEVGIQVCPHCGNELEWDISEAAVSAYTVEETVEDTLPKKVKKSMKWLLEWHNWWMLLSFFVPPVGWWLYFKNRNSEVYIVRHTILRDLIASLILPIMFAVIIVAMLVLKQKYAG